MKHSDQDRTRAQNFISLFVTLCLGLSLCGCAATNGSDADAGVSSDTAAIAASSSDNRQEYKTTAVSESTFDYAQVPEFNGTASVQINDNAPYFTADDIAYAKSNPGFESYGEQDHLARCTACWASVGAETMPAEGEERDEIGQVKPSGWHTVKYDSVDGKYLYNRCHLLGWQLTDENANIDNLITGTRYLNIEGMLPYENNVAAYVKRTGNHVLYRVTPVFMNDELVARGVLMEARSFEDDGAGLSFCVWCYNVQPGIDIDYVDGNSSEAHSEVVSSEDQPQMRSYILNTKSGKFHLESCSQVEKMSSANKKEVESTREGMIASGYTPCGTCNP